MDPDLVPPMPLMRGPVPHSAAGLLRAVSETVRRRRLVEVEDLELLATWAGMHSEDPTVGPDGARARRRGDVLVRLGGEGTPEVRDFCLGEIAMARGTGVSATTNALADVLDLQHRLPRTWAVCRAGDAEVQIARRVAKLSRHLPKARVGHVDSAIVQVIACESGGRVLEVAEGVIVAADTWLHETRAIAERRRRYVGFGRVDEYGLRSICGRVEAGEAVWIQACLERAADLLAAAHPDASRDELRSVGLALMARPAELLALLVQTASTEDAEDPDPQESGVPSRPTAFPADLLDALRAADLSALAPKAVLYVHLHEAALAGTAAGVARIDGLGPVTTHHLSGLLAGCQVRLTPVVDLADRVRTTAYEHPESLKERSMLITGGEYWPYGSSTSRRVDHDHPTPYEAHGPPGQTGIHNTGPLGRHRHRWKTHAGYRARQCGQGRYVWLSPNGLGFIVDSAGTRRVSTEHARAILDAPPGVDLYPQFE